MTATTRVADTSFSVGTSGKNQETGVLDWLPPTVLDGLSRSFGSGTAQLLATRSLARTADAAKASRSSDYLGADSPSVSYVQQFLSGLKQGYSNNLVAKVITPKVAASGIATDVLVTGAMNLKGQDVTQFTGFQSDEEKRNLRLVVGGSDESFKANTYNLHNPDWVNRLWMGNGYETKQVPNINTGIEPKVDFRTSGFGNDWKALRPYKSMDIEMRNAGAIK